MPWKHFHCRACNSAFFIQLGPIRKRLMKCPICKKRAGWNQDNYCPSGLSIYRPSPRDERGYVQCDKCGD